MWSIATAAATGQRTGSSKSPIRHRRTILRFGEFQANREQIESLRALVAGLARKGVLRLGKDVAPAFAAKTRVYKAHDPTLGIYAAYAYNDAGLIDDIRSVEGFMRHDLRGAMVYDIALLLREAKTKAYQTLFPFCPMLSQGWALLRVLGARCAGRSPRRIAASPRQPVDHLHA